MQSLITSPAPKRTTPKPTKTAVLDKLSDGTVAALSSNGIDLYRVRLDPLECTCPGFRHYGHCYHAEQAQERYGKPVEDPVEKANRLLYGVA
jgi:hypothetical protein